MRRTGPPSSMRFGPSQPVAPVRVAPLPTRMMPVDLPPEHTAFPLPRYDKTMGFEPSRVQGAPDQLRAASALAAMEAQERLDKRTVGRPLRHPALAVLDPEAANADPEAAEAYDALSTFADDPDWLAAGDDAAALDAASSGQSSPGADAVADYAATSYHQTTPQPAQRGLHGGPAARTPLEAYATEAVHPQVQRLETRRLLGDVLHQLVHESARTMGLRGVRGPDAAPDLPASAGGSADALAARMAIGDRAAIADAARIAGARGASAISGSVGNHLITDSATDRVSEARRKRQMGPERCTAALADLSHAIRAGTLAVPADLLAVTAALRAAHPAGHPLRFVSHVEPVNSGMRYTQMDMSHLSAWLDCLKAIEGWALGFHDPAAAAAVAAACPAAYGLAGLPVESVIDVAETFAHLQLLDVRGCYTDEPGKAPAMSRSERTFNTGLGYEDHPGDDFVAALEALVGSRTLAPTNPDARAGGFAAPGTSIGEPAPLNSGSYPPITPFAAEAPRAAFGGGQQPHTIAPSAWTAALTGQQLVRLGVTVFALFGTDAAARPAPGAIVGPLLTEVRRRLVTRSAATCAEPKVAAPPVAGLDVESLSVLFLATTVAGIAESWLATAALEAAADDPVRCPADLLLAAARFRPFPEDAVAALLPRVLAAHDEVAALKRETANAIAENQRSRLEAARALAPGGGVTSAAQGDTDTATASKAREVPPPLLPQAGEGADGWHTVLSHGRLLGAVREALLAFGDRQRAVALAASMRVDDRIYDTIPVLRALADGAAASASGSGTAGGGASCAATGTPVSPAPLISGCPPLVELDYDSGEAVPADHAPPQSIRGYRRWLAASSPSDFTACVTPREVAAAMAAVGAADQESTHRTGAVPTALAADAAAAVRDLGASVLRLPTLKLALDGPPDAATDSHDSASAGHGTAIAPLLSGSLVATRLATPGAAAVEAPVLHSAAVAGIVRNAAEMCRGGRAAMIVPAGALLALSARAAQPGSHGHAARLALSTVADLLATANAAVVPVTEEVALRPAGVRYGDEDLVAWDVAKHLSRCCPTTKPFVLLPSRRGSDAFAHAAVLSPAAAGHAQGGVLMALRGSRGENVAPPAGDIESALEAQRVAAEGGGLQDGAVLEVATKPLGGGQGKQQRLTTSRGVTGAEEDSLTAAMVKDMTAAPTPVGGNAASPRVAAARDSPALLAAAVAGTPAGGALLAPNSFLEQVAVGHKVRRIIHGSRASGLTAGQSEAALVTHSYQRFYNSGQQRIHAMPRPQRSMLDIKRLRAPALRQWGLDGHSRGLAGHDMRGIGVHTPDHAPH